MGSHGRSKTEERLQSPCTVRRARSVTWALGGFRHLSGGVLGLTSLRLSGEDRDPFQSPGRGSSQWSTLRWQLLARKENSMFSHPLDGSSLASWPVFSSPFFFPREGWMPLCSFLSLFILARLLSSFLALDTVPCCWAPGYVNLLNSGLEHPTVFFSSLLCCVLDRVR